jgi:hypothetical protein
MYTEPTKRNAGISGTCSLGMETDKRMLIAIFYSSVETVIFTHKWESC